LYEEFAGRLSVVHVDLYRLEHESEIEELGVFDLFGGDKVILAEWGDRSETLFAESDVVLRIGYLSETRRRLQVNYRRSTADIFQDWASWLS
jgi:tRNA threonylcarbamoyladenosine biosynthesis protein TsaE